MTANQKKIVEALSSGPKTYAEMGRPNMHALAGLEKTGAVVRSECPRRKTPVWAVGA